ncbi:MAG: hypothetical protein ACREQJ_18495 [Candidatus Binatia bacterium]
MQRLAIAFSILAVWSGCAAYDDRLIVHRTRGKVWIEGTRVGRLVTEQKMELPFTDCRVLDVSGEDDEGGREIWRITTVDPGAALAKLDYGRTPAGFAQVTPQAGRAPALRAGGDYRAECLGRRWMASPFTVPK